MASDDWAAVGWLQRLWTVDSNIQMTVRIENQFSSPSDSSSRGPAPTLPLQCCRLLQTAAVRRRDAVTKNRDLDQDHLTGVRLPRPYRLHLSHGSAPAPQSPVNRQCTKYL